MEATLQRHYLQQLHPTLDSQRIVNIVSELLKKYFLPVHVEVLCRGFRKLTGRDLPFREFGYSSPVEFLRDGCGNAFEVTQSQKDRSVFYVAPINGVAQSKSLTLKRESSTAVPSETNSTRKVLQTINNGSVPAVSPKKKSVPPQFRQYLRFLISRHSTGISAESLIAEFLRRSGSPLSYEMYGYTSHLEMFKDLSDVFTIRMSDGEVVLYPSSTSVSPSLAAPVTPTKLSIKKLVEPVLNTECETAPSSASRVKPVHSCESSRFPDVGKIALENGGSLVYVKYKGNHYVPTPCLASLAGLQCDTILGTLEAHNIEVQGVEVLRESVQEHKELRHEIALEECPLVITKAGGLIKEISLVPLRCVAILLRVFHSKRIELEKCLQSIEESFAQS